MYAYIVSNAWNLWSSKDMPSFLRIVGSPSLKENISDINDFRIASGFYVPIEKGWAVRYCFDLTTMENNARQGSELPDLSSLTI